MGIWCCETYLDVASTGLCLLPPSPPLDVAFIVALATPLVCDDEIEFWAVDELAPELATMLADEAMVGRAGAVRVTQR